MTPVLVTERLTLRALRESDADDLHPTLADPDVMRWWWRGPLESVAATRAYLAADRSPAPWRWIVTRTGEDRAIGWVSTSEKRPGGGVTEIGYLLAREAWGTGIAREAVSAVIDRLFAEGQRRVFADTDPDNVGSNALLERLGFRREGLLRAEWETHIGVRDSVMWGLLAGEWRQRQAAARST